MTTDKLIVMAACQLCLDGGPFPPWSPEPFFPYASAVAPTGVAARVSGTPNP